MIKHLILFLFLALVTCGLSAQNPDTLTKKQVPHHFMSINPLNTFLLQQYGVAYEYKTHSVGLGISTGYMNDSRMNFNRLFIAGSVNHGALEFYNGYYVHPQVNVFLKEFKNNKKTTLCYMGLKGIYKQMFCDSTGFHIWDSNTGGDYYWVYRKHKDNLKITGAFLVFGGRYVKMPFFVDFNFGGGMLSHKHNLIVAADKANSGTFIYDPPLNRTVQEKHFTGSVSINMGVTF